jgi:hypothetical protein
MIDLVFVSSGVLQATWHPLSTGSWAPTSVQCAPFALSVTKKRKTSNFFFRRSDEADKQSADKNRPMRKSMIKNRQQPEV